jgi:hypothetical protein
MTATQDTPAISAPAAISYEANLKALAKLNRDLAASLEEVVPYGPDEIEFVETADGVPSARLEGRWLASRRRPLAEVPGLLEKANVREKPVVVILGLGLGYHVREICRLMGVKGAVLVFEPDRRLLRTVLERVDCRWMGTSNLIVFTEAEDGSALSVQLRGQDPFVAQGVQYVEHPPSKARLGESATTFTSTFTRYVAATKLSIQTTLVQMEATARNILANLKQYAGGDGILELRGCCKGFPAIVVSAGPSLAKNVALLKQPGVRERCVIIAVQTVLKPLLQQGIRPHFVTALDYHEISKRFYEGLTEEDVRGVQLVCEPKSNPAILDAFPGPIRNCADPLARLVLRGAIDRDLGGITAGATVAHLAFYLAQHLGCDPIGFVGQDLGFTDGLYYGGRNPIHEVWGPELNPFRTLEMLEWERIKRNGSRLSKREDHEGRSIFVDDQMHTYQDQFERDFATAPQRVIDASEGGTRKQHTEILSLAAMLEECLGDELPEIPLAAKTLDRERLRTAIEQVRKVREEVRELRRLGKETGALLRKMLADFDDRPRMEPHFRKLERKRAEVKKLDRAFTVVQILNQTGTFRRLRADRAIAMEKDLPALEKQRRQLERDLPNVEWIHDAAGVMVNLLTLAEERMRSEVEGSELPAKSYTRSPSARGESGGTAKAKASEPVSAVLPIRRQQLPHLARQPRLEEGDERTLLQLTLARLNECRHLSGITILTPCPAETAALLALKPGDLTVEIVETAGDPLGAKQESVLAARAFAPSSWRGTLANLTAYDEVIAAQAALPVLEAAGLSAGLFVGPDWALLDAGLCDRLIEQYWEAPDRYALVFTQAPPGLCGALLSKPVLEQLAEPQQLATLGSVLGYVPVKPQADPIAKDHCLKIEQAVRQSLESAVLDTPDRLQRFVEVLGGEHLTAARVIEHAAATARQRAPAFAEQLVVELCTERQTEGPAAVPTRGADGERLERAPLTREQYEQLLAELPANALPAISFAGVGDPLLHPECPSFVGLAKERGARVHVQTDLLATEETLAALIEAGVDVISINLSALRGVTYEAAMGRTDLRQVLTNLEFLRGRQRELDGLTMPWIVPRLVRCDATYEDIEGFYDKWLLILQTAVIEPMPSWSPYAAEQRLQPVPVPEAVRQAERRRTLFVRCDGGVVSAPAHLYREPVLGTIGDEPLGDLWRRAYEATLHD